MPEAPPQPLAVMLRSLPRRRAVGVSGTGDDGLPEHRTADAGVAGRA